MATVNMITEAQVVVTSNFCYVGHWDCEDSLHNCPGRCGYVVYIDSAGNQVEQNGICGNTVITINAQSIVEAIGVDSVDCGVTEFTFDADYAVLTYKFNDGRDLDTRSRIVTPDIGMNQYLGFAAGNCFPAPTSGTTWSTTQIPSEAVIDWSGDNTGTGYESILIDIPKLKAIKSDMINLVVDLRAGWYPSDPEPMGVLPVEVKAIFYKGGTMLKSQPVTSPLSYEYTNPTATSQLEVTSNSKVITTRFNDDGGVRCERLAVFKYNVVTKVGSFDINDTTTPAL